MAEITQTLGFNVSEALTALTQLDQKMEGLEKRLGSAADALTKFNQAGAGVGGGGKGAIQGVDEYVAKLQSLYSVSNTASVQQQRAFQSAITGAAEFAAKNKISIDQVVQQSGNLSASYTGTANVLADRLAAIDRASQEKLTSAGNRINGLAVTWQTMVRVVTTQLIVRAMSMLRNALEGSVTAAINFETRLAEIQTIGGPAAGSLKMLAIQMKGLSEEFAKPIEDVAEGYYEILSNQIGNAAESFTVARESARLATAAVSSFADAANALSSVINSYKMHASDAADISGKLFATVEMGRLRLSDIANTLGRVTVLAHEVGVSLDEVFASIATLTISGLKPDESMTLLANAMRGLLKPTKDMSKAFDELGVVNAEVGIATYGFQGFLEKLRGTTNGTATEIAKLTQNIRVGRGVIGLTGEATETYRKNLEAIRGAGGETTSAKTKLILETNAQQVQREFTSLRNFFINDFGINALKVIKQLLDNFGGLVNIVKSLQASFVWIVTIIALFKGVALAVTAVNFALTTQQTVAQIAMGAMRGLAAATISIPGVIGIMAIVGGLIAWASAGKDAAKSTADLQQKADEAFNSLREKNDKLAASETITLKKVQAARTAVVEEAISKQLLLTSELQKLYEKDKDNAEDAQKAILDNLKSQMSDRLSLITKLIGELQRKQDEAKRVIDKNKDESASLKLQGEERYVDRQIGRLGDQEKAVLQLKRARELEGQAGKLSQTADFKGSEELLKTADQRANAALELGEARLKEAKTIEEQQNALTAISEAEREVYSILQQRLGLREAENKAALAQAAAAEQEIRARREQLRDAKSLVKEIEQYQVLGKKAGAKPEEQAANREKALAAVDRLEQVLSRGDVSLEQFLGIQEMTAKIRGGFESAITDRPVSLSFAFKEGIDAILAPIEAHKLRFQAIITDLETTSGAKFDLSKGYADIQIKIRENGEELKKALNDVTSLASETRNLDTFKSQINTLRDSLFRDTNLAQPMVELLTHTGVAVDQALNGQFKALADQRDAFASAADKFSNQAAITTDTSAKASLDATAKRLAELSEAASQLMNTQATVTKLKAVEPQALGAINQAAAAGDKAAEALMLLRIQEGQKVTIEYQKTLVERTRELPTAAEAASPRVVSALDAISTSAGKAAEKVGALQGALNLINPVSNTNFVRNIWDYWSGNNTMSGQPGTWSAGGLVSRMKFFESGGAARGTDTIPAMVGAGEFITNAKNSRRFLPQLQAINSGIPPAYEPGGVTNNTTVGDIIVNGAQQPKMVAREVMSAIRREQRRGSGRL
ncbi:MAG: phage tail tape measure protein [Pirellulales bacterium]